MDIKQIAEQLCQKANDKLTRDKETWKGDDGMIEMFVDDCDDAKRISDLIAESKFEKATEELLSYDTASRDVIFGMLEHINKEFVEKHIDSNIPY